MKGTLIIGYDIETASQNTIGFLDGAKELHNKHNVPWSIYITGKTVDTHPEYLKEIVNDPLLLSVGQHTYGHLMLKSIYMQPGDGKPIHNSYPNFFRSGVSLSKIKEEIERTNQVISNRLSITCEGFTAPWSYYRGLADREDLLEIIKDYGFKWIRAYGRDYRDCQPVPFSVQPFFYKDQGFPDILELGIQGYNDLFYWERFDDRKYGDAYQDYIYAMLEKINKENLVWNICAHDHHTPTKEVFFKKNKWIEDLIVRAKDLGIRFLSPDKYYKEKILGNKEIDNEN